MAYCFAGEVFISEKLKKMREIRRIGIVAPTVHNRSPVTLSNLPGIPIRIEAATYQGEAIDFEIIGLWT